MQIGPWLSAFIIYDFESMCSAVDIFGVGELADRGLRGPAPASLPKKSPASWYACRVDSKLYQAIGHV